MSKYGSEGSACRPREEPVAAGAGAGASREATAGGAHAIRASPATASGSSAHGDQVGWDAGPCWA